MGKAFSRLGNKATKPVRDYNIEERAFKAIMKEQRPRAPRHESTARLIDDSLKRLPEEVKKGLKEKDSELLERLRTVYVTSKDVTPERKISEATSERPLPTDRSNIDEPKYGFHEPSKIPYGKITLRDALDVISKHQQDPETWTAKTISYEYKLDTKLTEKMLQYFRTFLLIVPEKEKITREMLSASPMSAPIYLKQLPSGKDQSKKNEEDSKDESPKS